ncbi:hypothetical protein BDA99DRAFT_510843 [Phascolomyces articulosus]|uniref:Uncharacterized protein n=1 Tax=Phascolomyces articulosus TaxID=60185 RepID=A0AAD5JZY1_9FUNG|nr:hypothetical protein BDA99DRAFT_510843 [Phascolomyces articulosus]
MIKTSIIFPDDKDYGFTQPPGPPSSSQKPSHYRRYKLKKAPCSSHLSNPPTSKLTTLRPITLRYSNIVQRTPRIEPENLPLICVDKKRGGRPEVVYNHIQPSNVCYGCVEGHRFCYFECRGPKARLRRCKACVDRHISCVMTPQPEKINHKKMNVVPDPLGKLIVPDDFKHYFLRYYWALQVLEYQDEILLKEEKGHEKVKYAKDFVRRFRPVTLKTLRNYDPNTSTLRSTQNKNNEDPQQVVSDISDIESN